MASNGQTIPNRWYLAGFLGMALLAVFAAVTALRLRRRTVRSVAAAEPAPPQETVG